MRKKLKLACLILLAFLYSNVEAASHVQITDNKKTGIPNSTQENVESYKLIRELIQYSLPNSEKIESLEAKLEAQNKRIEELEGALKKAQAPETNDTATLVLSAVSVIITVLGVLIAILSILGYRNIKKETIKDAKKTAKDVVNVITLKELPGETEKNIIKLIDENKFDRIIQNAVEKVVYRGISIEDESLDEANEN